MTAAGVEETQVITLPTRLSYAPVRRMGRVIANRFVARVGLLRPLSRPKAAAILEAHGQIFRRAVRSRSIEVRPPLVGTRSFWRRVGLVAARDSPEGLDHFADIVLEAAVGTVGVVKIQAAFYERHG